VPANTDKLSSLREILGPDGIRDDRETLSRYAVDGVLPWGVLFPGNTEQISQVVRQAFREKWSVVPWGSGSKMSMGHPLERLDMVLCTSRLNKIIDMDTANLTVTVQAGVRFKQVQSNLASEENRCYIPLEDPVTLSPDGVVCSDREHKGCFVPMAPPYSDSTTMGGTIATNACGPIRLLYGMPRDIVLGVRYVASNGDIIGMGGKTVKNVSGYDMCKLMIGSMGSLGILCEMTLRLLPLPERLGTSFSTFASLDGACGFVDGIFETQLLPAAVELVNSRTSKLLVPEEPGGLQDKGYAVAIALEGAQEAVQRMASEIKDAATESGALNIAYMQEAEHRLFWDSYSNLLSRTSQQLEGSVSLKLNYPVSRYREVLAFVDSLTSGNRLNPVVTAHAGNGVSYVHALPEPGDAEAPDRVVRMAEKLLERCGELGGNFVVERAGPELKKKLPIWGLERDDLIVMKRIKEQMDPSGILSPGRFVGGI
jgi:FAD/FMN-containing dehydrogenase